MAKTINYDDMVNRVHALRSEGQDKAAADAGGVEDPRNKGTASIPDHPDGDNPEKTKIPDGSRPTNTTGVDDGLTHHVTKPGGTGENQPPAPGDQNAKDDAFTSPTTPIEKIAGAVAGLNALKAETAGETEKSAAAETPTEETEKSAAAETPSGEETEKAAAEGGEKPAGETPDVEKTASDIELSDDAHIKLASEILADEKGREWAAEFLTERHGEKVAHAMIQDAHALKEEMEKAAAEEAYMAKQAAAAQDEHVRHVEEMLKQASPEEREVFMKCAVAHDGAITANYADDPIAQELYKQGAADAGMAQAMMAAEGGSPEMPMLPGAGGVEDGQIEQVVAAMVQSGELTPEEAEAIMAALAGGGAPGEEAPPAEGGEAIPMEGGAPPAEAPPEEMPKAASAEEITQEIFEQHVANQTAGADA